MASTSPVPLSGTELCRQRNIERLKEVLNDLKNDLIEAQLETRYCREGKHGRCDLPAKKARERVSDMNWEPERRQEHMQRLINDRDTANQKLAEALSRTERIEVYVKKLVADSGY